jgi:hypothetical protein
MNDFNSQVALYRQIGCEPKHKPANAKKSDCSSLQWAQHQEWQAEYYKKNKRVFKIYQRRWEAKVK